VAILDIRWRNRAQRPDTVVGRYSVMAFPANHAPGLGAMLYSIQANGRAIFYGTDTATLFEHTWQAFREHKMRLMLLPWITPMVPNSVAVTISAPIK